jgi:hypothetical protein
VITTLEWCALIMVLYFECWTLLSMRHGKMIDFRCFGGYLSIQQMSLKLFYIFCTEKICQAKNTLHWGSFNIFYLLALKLDIDNYFCKAFYFVIKVPFLPHKSIFYQKTIHEMLKSQIITVIDVSGWYIYIYLQRICFTKFYTSRILEGFFFNKEIKNKKRVVDVFLLFCYSWVIATHN